MEINLSYFLFWTTILPLCYFSFFCCTVLGTVEESLEVNVHFVEFVFTNDWSEIRWNYDIWKALPFFTTYIFSNIIKGITFKVKFTFGSQEMWKMPDEFLMLLFSFTLCYNHFYSCSRTMHEIWWNLTFSHHWKHCKIVIWYKGQQQEQCSFLKKINELFARLESIIWKCDKLFQMILLII